MKKEEIIESIWEKSGHGTREIDIETAFNAGITFCRREAVALVAELLSEAEGWLDDARGCKPDDVIGYTGWDERARRFIVDA